MPRPEWIEVGRVSRAHGVHGEVRVLPSSDNPDRFRPGAVLLCRPERAGVAGLRAQALVELTIESVRGDAAFPIVSFEEVADRTHAEALRGHVLLVSADELPPLPEDEYYPFDLLGVEVRDEDGVVRGVLADVLESPAHWMLIVRLSESEDGVDDAEVMVPFVHEAVPEVEPEEGFIVVVSRFLS